MTDTRARVLQRWEALKSERSSWLGTWRDIARHVQPRAGRLLNSAQENRGDRRDELILDNTATNALRTLGSGLMAGMTSPARPWFQLTTSDPELDEAAGVKRWLRDVQELMQMVFRRSNTYQALHGCYEELGAFGTCASVVVDDFDTVLLHHPLTVGEYAVATDQNHTVNTLYRELQLTAEQCVSQFGYANCSQAVRNLYDNRNYDAWVPVVHAIEPRHQRDVRKRDAQNMAWRSVYLEPGGHGLLRESGFRAFPALVARWQTYGSDIYGGSPAMQALGKRLRSQCSSARNTRTRCMANNRWAAGCLTSNLPRGLSGFVAKERPSVARCTAWVTAGCRPSARCSSPTHKSAYRRDSSPPRNAPTKTRTCDRSRPWL